jgi:hypothetical protein
MVLNGVLGEVGRLENAKKKRRSKDISGIKSLISLNESIHFK